MYSNIINPETGKKINIRSYIGGQILRKYVMIMNGGAGASGPPIGRQTLRDLEMEWVHTQEKNWSTSDIIDAINSAQCWCSTCEAMLVDGMRLIDYPAATINRVDLDKSSVSPDEGAHRMKLFEKIKPQIIYYPEDYRGKWKLAPIRHPLYTQLAKEKRRIIQSKFELFPTIKSERELLWRTDSEITDKPLVIFLGGGNRVLATTVYELGMFVKICGDHDDADIIGDWGTPDFWEQITRAVGIKKCILIIDAGSDSWLQGQVLRYLIQFVLNSVNLFITQVSRDGAIFRTDLNLITEFNDKFDAKGTFSLSDGSIIIEALPVAILRRKDADITTSGTYEPLENLINIFSEGPKKRALNVKTYLKIVEDAINENS